MAAIRDTEGVDAYMVERRDMRQVVGGVWEESNMMSALVGAFITPNNVVEKPSSVVLPEKHADFSDIFERLVQINCPPIVNMIQR